MAEALFGNLQPLTHGQIRSCSDLRQAQRYLPSGTKHRGRAVDARWNKRNRIVSRASSSEATDLSLTDLQLLLEDAIRQENYQEAARLRDVLTQRESDSRSAIEDANAEFYRAFKSRDLKAMSEIWGTGEHVQCIHPAAGCIAGRDNVLESWRVILRGMPMDISLEDVRVCARDGAAFVTCVEIMEAGDSRGRTVATNVFERQNGKWVIVHHHGGPAPMFM
ncbi:g2633 [Coccomyxa viridis]|uniref:G2633 protein n=1 Tax=Coccomyxa viridis TaxID=1274662 RepID=A0ABP1FKW4_9CHLO